MKLRPGKWPLYGWVGLVLIGIFWTTNWSLSGLRTHWGFFPMWLGYCMVVDALVFMRKGNSLISRNVGTFVGMFLISAPCWWLFELLNRRLQNWTYLGRQFSPMLPSVLLDSMSFSTVMPAVFETAELAASFRWVQRLKGGPSIKHTSTTIWLLFVTGSVMLGATLAWPEYWYACIWMALFFILEPINFWIGGRTLIAHTANRDWRPVISLWIGCLICGIFWEMWNYYSYPKWVYDTPGINFWHFFEMPVLGYLGYLPFALELFALYHFVCRLLRWRGGQMSLRIESS